MAREETSRTAIDVLTRPPHAKGGGRTHASRMDKAEAQQILSRELAKYRARSYGQLRGLVGDVDAYEVTGPSGNSYQIEAQSLWEDDPGGNLLFIIGIDDGGWSAFAPMTESFLLGPDGKFVGE